MPSNLLNLLIPAIVQLFHTIFTKNSQRLLSHAAVICLVTQRSSLRDETNNGCMGD